MPERINVSAITILITGVASLIFTVALMVLYSMGGLRPRPDFLTEGFSIFFIGSWFFFVVIVATLVILVGLFLFGRSKEKGVTDKEFVLIGTLLWVSSIAVPFIAICLLYLEFVRSYY